MDLSILSNPILIFGCIGAIGGLCRTLDWYLNNEKGLQMRYAKVLRNLIFGAAGGALLGESPITAFAAGAFFELSVISIVWDGIVKNRSK